MAQKLDPSKALEPVHKGATPIAKGDYTLGGSIRTPLSLPSGGDGTSRLSFNQIGWQQQHLHDAALQWRAYVQNPWVRSCIDLIAQAATADKYGIVSSDDKEREALETLLEDIAPRTTFDRLLRTIYRDLEINGNCYIRVTFRNGFPSSLHRIDFRQIVPDLPEKGFGEIKSYSVYEGGDTTLSPMKLKAREVIHITLNDSGENSTGLSPLESLDETLSLAVYSTKFQRGFFKNGVKAGDIYASDGEMDPDTYDKDKAYLVANYTQPDQSYSPLFLLGNWKLVARGQDVRKDGDFLALLSWLREEIASVLSVPLSLLSTQSKGAMGGEGKEQDRMLFLNQVISPLQKQVLEDVNQQLLVNLFGNNRVRLAPPGRAALRLEDMQAAKLLTQVGATLNEVRAAVNLASIGPDGDIVLMLQPGATLVGPPGSPNSIILTSKGPFPGTPDHPLSPLMHQDTDVLANPGEDDEPAEMKDYYDKPEDSSTTGYGYNPAIQAP